MTENSRPEHLELTESDQAQAVFSSLIGRGMSTTRGCGTRHKGAYYRTFPGKEANYLYAIKNQGGAPGGVLDARAGSLGHTIASGAISRNSPRRRGGPVWFQVSPFVKTKKTEKVKS